MYTHLLVDDLPPVRVITLNRPEVLNALNTTMRAEVIDALTRANADDAVGAVVLTGAGERAFAAGQDLNEAREFSPERARTWIDEFHALYEAIQLLDKPSVAALNGYAVGAGLQVALLCDLRVAAEHARVGMPEINDGIPCITGTWTLWDLIGRARTVDLVLTGRLLDVGEALHWGLIHRVVPTADLREAALALARDLAGKPRTAVRLNKQRWRQLSRAAAEDTKAFAKEAHATAFASGEPRAAMEAFLAKRRAKG